MIDDDEVPVPEWLDSLLATALAHDASLGAGPVVPSFVEAPPAWAVEGRFFEVGPFVDGSPIEPSLTGNALVSLRAVRAAGWRFEMAFKHSGGEDEHFFTRALQAGLKAVSAADARIIETIPPGRTTPRWILRRYFRMGTTLAAIDRLQGRPTTALLRRGFKGCGRMVLGALTLASAVLQGPAWRSFAALADIARVPVALAACAGIRFGEYRPAR
jgi:hypothetical protein